MELCYCNMGAISKSESIFFRYARKRFCVDRYNIYGMFISIFFSHCNHQSEAMFCKFSTLFRTIANYNYVRILIRIIKCYINSTKNRDNEEKFLSQLSSSSEGIPNKSWNEKITKRDNLINTEQYNEVRFPTRSRIWLTVVTVREVGLLMMTIMPLYPTLISSEWQ